MSKQLEVNTSHTSYFYNKYRNILIPTYSDIHYRNQCVVPEDDNAMYFWTKWLFDTELLMINEERTKCNFPPLIRLAYTGGDKYVRVNSIAERYQVEKKCFEGKKDFISYPDVKMKQYKDEF